MNDVKISGAGKIAGGSYNQVKIAGSGTIEGDLSASELLMSGATRVKGSLNCKKISGSGAVRVQGNITSDECKFSGAVNVEGTLHAQTCRVSGAIRAKDEINVEHFYLKSNNSELTMIHGETVIIERPNCFHFFSRNHNIVDEIEATTIQVESLKAKRISGANVTIGPNCDIDVVEYSENLQTHKDAKIKETIKN